MLSSKVLGLAALCAAISSLGCTVSVSTDSDSSPEEVLELESGAIVGAFELAVPGSTVFTLRGTLPVPPGTWPSEDGQVPFTILDYDGSAVNAQVETVSRYAVDAEGADVVEILARVHRDPAVAAGTRVRYNVSFAPHADSAGPSSPGVEELSAGVTDVPSVISSFLTESANLVISATDVFGNDYTTRPLDGDNATLLRHGDVMTQLRTYDTMLPSTPDAGPTGTLPHLFGVHSYMSVMKDEEVILFDLRFNNGADGNDLSTSVDDPLSKLYFEKIEIQIPDGWVLLQDAVDPFFGDPSTSGGTTTYPIVKRIGDGTMHLMPSQGQFHRRLVIAPSDRQFVAQGYLDQGGLAFCVDDTDLETGLPLLSWWNHLTPSYAPQRHRLPSLEHMGLDGLRTTLTNEFDELRGHLVNGTDTGGNYPVEVGTLGWAHPYGVGYGGMTGGAEIHLYSGIRTAASASVEGYKRLSDNLRMAMDRMPVALYHANGRPSRLNDWVIHEPAYSYVPFFYFNGKQNSGADAFGYDDAPDFQVNHVEANNLVPEYKEALEDFQAHDRNHITRVSRLQKALTWLGNDALAKDEILMTAENFHLEYHQHYNSFYQSAQGTSLLASTFDVIALPGRGFHIGRGEGWGFDITTAAYSTSHDADYRDYTRTWLELVVETINDGQADCSGIIESKTSKWLDSKYRVRSSIEMSILESGLRAVRERIFEDVSPAHEAMLDDILHDSYYGMISSLSWEPGNAGPWSHLATGELDHAGTVPFCTGGDLPVDGHDQYTENFQCWSSLAYAYELTLNPIFLDYARMMTDGGSLTVSLEADGDENLENRAALLALVQVIGD
jgi:hypothetical protein